MMLPKFPKLHVVSTHFTNFTKGRAGHGWGCARWGWKWLLKFWWIFHNVVKDSKISHKSGIVHSHGASESVFSKSKLLLRVVIKKNDAAQISKKISYRWPCIRMVQVTQPYLYPPQVQLLLIAAYKLCKLGSDKILTKSFTYKILYWMSRA